jgi:hypothetical protein
MFGKKGFFRICATGTLTGFAGRMVGNVIALFKASEFHSERVHILSSLHLMADFFCQSVVSIYRIRQTLDHMAPCCIAPLL